MTRPMETAKNYRNPTNLVKSKTARFVLDKHHYWREGLPLGLRVPEPVDVPSIIAVGGGKGGVGKSIISANFSSLLVAQGYKVLVVDLDLGCSNLHTQFGLPPAQKTLVDYLVRKNCTFFESISTGPTSNLSILAGGGEEDWNKYINADTHLLRTLWQEILYCKINYRYDIVVLDLGAGTYKHTMDSYSLAHLGLLTALPEPTSIENAYVFLKMYLWKVVENIALRMDAADIALEVHKRLGAVRPGALEDGYLKCLQDLKPLYPEFISNVAKALAGRLLGIVMNQARDQSDWDIGKSMEHICSRYFGFQTYYLGCLNYDESVIKSVRNRNLLISQFPVSLIAKRLDQLVHRVLYLLGHERMVHGNKS
ncbi:MAG: MinD/ParA family protein [Oligoflexales bacterium]